MSYILDTKVVGVTFANTGRNTENRQAIIQDLNHRGLLNPGQELRLERDPQNPYDRNAISVIGPDGRQIGNLSKENAAMLAPMIDSGAKYTVTVSSLTGGNGYSYGINIRVVQIEEPLQRSSIDSDSSSMTVLNANALRQSTATVLNGQIEQQNGTVLNNQIASNDTVLNANVQHESFISTGTLLCEVYEVIERLNVNAGEADLYLCSFAARKYIAKVYRRKIAIKPEVAERLSQIHSPFVARIFAMGEYQGHPVEILPYYANGSLAGKKFSFDQLKYEIIPSLNEGLHILHTNGIIHKDVKPSNIMLNNDGRTVAIIDFGISSLRDEGSTVIVTRTGLTPEYSAPETFKNLFLSESDYYSFGVTICELFSGHSPYSGLSQEEIEQFASIQQLPTPPEMDKTLVELVNALTYADIRNRRDKSNPNRRWGYEEVSNWCNDIPQVLPGQTPNAHSVEMRTPYVSAMTPGAQGDMLPYRFGGQAITSTKELAKALNGRWDEGKKHLFRGLLLDHFRKDSNAEIVSYLMDFQEESESGDPDTIMFKCLYAIDSELKEFLWKGKSFSNLSEFGYEYLCAIRGGKDDFLLMVDDILSKGILSQYISFVEPSASKQIDIMHAFESEHRTYRTSGDDLLAKRYRLAYTLSDIKDYAVGSEHFDNVESFTEYLIKLASQKDNSFEFELRSTVFGDGKNFDVQFVCWLQAIGQKSLIDDSAVNKEKDFFSLIYKMNPALTSLSWQNITFEDISDLGVRYISALRTGDKQVVSVVEELFSKGFVEEYLRKVSPDDMQLLKSLQKAEKEFSNISASSQHDAMVYRFNIAYLLSGDKTFIYDSMVFRSIETLVSYIHALFKKSLNRFDKVCNELLNADETLNPELEAWLVAIGKSDVLNSWKSGAPFVSKREKRRQMESNYKSNVEKMEKGYSVTLAEREKWYSDLADYFEAMGEYEQSAAYAEECRLRGLEAQAEVLIDQKKKEYLKIVKKLEQESTIPQADREKWYLGIADALSEYTDDIYEAAERIEYCKKRALTYQIMTIYNQAIRLQAKAKKETGEARRLAFLEAAELFDKAGRSYGADKLAAECRAASENPDYYLEKEQPKTKAAETVPRTASTIVKKYYSVPAHISAWDNCPFCKKQLSIKELQVKVSDDSLASDFVTISFRTCGKCDRHYLTTSDEKGIDFDKLDLKAIIDPAFDAFFLGQTNPQESKSMPAVIKKYYPVSLDGQKLIQCPFCRKALTVGPYPVENKAGQVKKLTMRVCPNCDRHYIQLNELSESVDLSFYKLKPIEDEMFDKKLREFLEEQRSDERLPMVGMFGFVTDD